MSEHDEQDGTEKLRLSEALESLTGFEVLAIEDHMRADLADLSGTRLTLGVAFTLKRREGMAAKDAWQHVKGMTLKQLNDQFAPEPQDDEDDASQELGNG